MTGNELKAIRKKLGFTQAELGERLQRTSKQIRRWEKNDVPVPFWATILLQKYLPVK